MAKVLPFLGRAWRVVWPHLNGRRSRERKWRPQTYILAARRDIVWQVALCEDALTREYLADLDGLADDASQRTVVIARSVKTSGEPTLKVTRVTGEMLGFIGDDDLAAASDLLRVYEISRLRYHMLRELRFRVQLFAVDTTPLIAELWIQDPIKMVDAYWVKEPLANRSNGS